MSKSTASELSFDDIPKLKYNGELQISLGSSRFEKKWKNRSMTWAYLLSRLSRSQQTGETHAEYMKLPKVRQDQIKDIGGFVGGRLREGRRKSGFVEARQILTLDVDNAPVDFWDLLMGKAVEEPILDAAACLYSTHKHTPTKPRLRLIMPLDREVSADEYEAIARKTAELLGIDYFDDSTYQPERLMYWPSNPVDVDPVFETYDAPFLKADDVLGLYPDWTDISYWPYSSRVAEVQKKSAEKQGNPLEKKGPVGLFCRTYTVTEAIAAFLSDVYEPTVKEDRWTYSAGSTSGGLVIYDGDLFAYSNHGTDPAGGQLCNAFDLVRIHKFAELDEGSEERGANAPSFKAMRDMIREDPGCLRKLYEERDAEAKEDFAGETEDTKDWRLQLQLTANMTVATTLANAVMILRMDERLQGIRLNEMSSRIEAEGVPWARPAGSWRDADDARLAEWLTREYRAEFPMTKLSLALLAVADSRRFHPVQEYLDSLPAWDGIERVDQLLIKYLGAEDSIYTREVTRKTLTAAVARVYQPGIKFDNVLVLWGKQGYGKSTLFSRLGGPWFSDSLTMQDMRDVKTGGEKIQGSWIVEIGEMAGMRRVEVEAVKSFLSRQDDRFRAAYGRNVESRPRRCIIVGSTNDESGFLRDITGNRRFWPVPISPELGDIHSWDLTPEIVAQVWAEVKAGYDVDGADLVLSREAEEIAQSKQRDALETDERQGIVEAYLDRKIPERWEEMDADARALFLDSEEQGEMDRTQVSNMEIWVEALHRQATALDLRESRALTAIMLKIPGWTRSGQARIPIYGKQRIYRKRNKEQ